jgi:hypothetical protein
MVLGDVTLLSRYYNFQGNDSHREVRGEISSRVFAGRATRKSLKQADEETC